MNEVALSSDLSQLAVEVKTYQSIGGQAIFEIGRRLKFVKEQHLEHGQFMKWLASVNIGVRQAERYIKIASDPMLNTTALADKGPSVLYELAGVPVQERNKPQELPSGEVKKPMDMSQRELQSLKTQMRKKDKQVTDLFAENQRLRTAPPKTIEKKVEVAPADYADTKALAKQLKLEVEYLKQRNENLEQDIKDAQADRAKYETDSEEYRKLTKRIDDLRGEFSRLDRKHSAAADMITFEGQIVKMLSEIAPEAYTIDFVEFRFDDPAMQTLRNAVDHVADWCKDMYASMPSSEIMEGDTDNG